MIVDAFKIVVWIIERYSLEDKVLSHLISGRQIVTGDIEIYTKEEAVMVEPKKMYLMHFDEPFQTSEDLKNKMIECTNLSKEDQRND